MADQGRGRDQRRGALTKKRVGGEEERSGRKGRGVGELEDVWTNLKERG